MIFMVRRMGPADAPLLGGEKVNVVTAQQQGSW